MKTDTAFTFRRFAALLLILALTRCFVSGLRSSTGTVPSDLGQLRSVWIDPSRMRAEEWALLPGLGPTLGRRAQQVWHERRDLRPRERLLAVPGIGPITCERVLPWLARPGALPLE